MNSRLGNLNKQFEQPQNYYIKELEADGSSSHAVSQFVLVPEERHKAHVSLDEYIVIQDQDAIGLPRKWLLGVGFLRCILELLTELLDVTESSKCVTDVPHRVVGEGVEREVDGEGVPPGGKGGLSQPVPEHSHTLPPSLKQGVLWEDEFAMGDAVDNVQWDPLDLLTVEHDEVVLEDQERVVCDESETLFFIVPVVHLCQQPNAVNAAIYFFIHQSFDVFDGLIQSARPQNEELPDLKLVQR